MHTEDQKEIFVIVGVPQSTSFGKAQVDGASNMASRSVGRNEGSQSVSITESSIVLRTSQFNLCLSTLLISGIYLPRWNE